METAGMIKIASGDGSPFGRVPEWAPDWFFVATEACGGGTSHLGFFLGVWVFIGIFGIGLMQGGLRVVHEAGGAPSTLVAPLTYFFRLYISIYPKTIGDRIDREFRRRKPL